MVIVKTAVVTVVAVVLVMPNLPVAPMTEARAVMDVTTATGPMRRAWVILHFALSATRWSKPSLRCASWQLRPMVKL